MNIKTIIDYIDNYLIKARRQNIDPVEGNEILEKAKLLRDSKDRPGKPLRDLLRKGLLPHAYQSGGKGTSWTIPHSNKGKTKTSNYESKYDNISKDTKQTTLSTKQTDFLEVTNKLENARLKYKPEKIKYLLIAEAPPDSLERFFYYENVKQHDYLFLGVVEALYPELKQRFLASKRNSEIKTTILQKLSADGFYLIDLSDLPLSLLHGSLKNQLPKLIKKVKNVTDKQTQIILIKANVYDTAYTILKTHGFKKVVDVRIPFPGQGNQKKFQVEFKKALNKIYYK